MALEDRLTEGFAAVDQTMQALANSVQTMWRNQKELAKSEDLLDEQFAVSTRMMILSINTVLEKIGAEERIDAQDVEQMFRDWADFRKRPDYRSLMMEWFMGVALDKLPPPQEVNKEGEVHAEGDQGDEEAVSRQPQDSSLGQTDDVPELPSNDGAES